MKLNENGEIICEHCGANLVEVGIIETTEGGHGETAIHIKDGYVVYERTTIENMESYYAICGNCGEELNKDEEESDESEEEESDESEEERVSVEDLVNAIEHAGKPLPDIFEVINDYRELWSAVENGDLDRKFFELREKIRKVLG